MKLALKAAICAFTLLSGGAAAQSDDVPTYMPWGAGIGLVQNVDLRVSDQVSDNCWTNAELIRSNAFLKFEQNGIFVPDYEIAFVDSMSPIVEISAFGFRTSGGICAVSARFEVYHRSSNEIGGYGGKEAFSFPVVVEVFEQASIFTNPGNVNDQLRDFIDAQISDFIATGISARRSAEFQRYLEVFPSSDEPPMSQEEYDAFIGGLNSEPADK